MLLHTLPCLFKAKLLTLKLIPFQSGRDDMHPPLQLPPLLHPPSPPSKGWLAILREIHPLLPDPPPYTPILPTSFSSKGWRLAPQIKEPGSPKSSSSPHPHTKQYTRLSIGLSAIHPVVNQPAFITDVYQSTNNEAAIR